MNNFKINTKFLIVATGVVLVWRGVWGYADLFLFPNNSILSFSVSIVLGVILVVLNHEKLNDLF